MTNTPRPQVINVPEYDVITSKDLKTLIDAVNNKTSDGWIVLGNICYDGKQYLQSMILVPPQQMPMRQPQQAVTRQIPPGRPNPQ